MSEQPTPRDARGTGPRSRGGSVFAIIGLVAIVFVALMVLWTPSPESTHTVSDAPSAPPADTLKE
jgi:hypothetical protein